jgi:hypothetical protein
MTGDFNELIGCEESSSDSYRMREGFFSRQPTPIFGEAIFIARITSMIDCFVVPPRNDDL